METTCKSKLLIFSVSINSWLGYYFVDDLTLIAPSRKALQTMISICEGYAADYDVIFNGPKSHFFCANWVNNLIMYPHTKNKEIHVTRIIYYIKTTP